MNPVGLAVLPRQRHVIAPDGPRHLPEQQVAPVVHDVPAELHVVHAGLARQSASLQSMNPSPSLSAPSVQFSLAPPGARKGATWAKYDAKAPSTVALSALSHVSPTLNPHPPESWPTTSPAAFSTGEPLLPPSVAPTTSRL